MILKLFKNVLPLICIIACTFTFPSLLYADGTKKGDLKGMGWAYENENEFQAFPEYCKAKFYPKDSPISKKWRKIIGPDFIHIHHYCRGLTLLGRGRVEFDNKKKENILTSAINEMNYTLKHSSKQLNPKFRAMIHEHIAQAFYLMGKNQQAFVERKKSELLKGNK